MAIPVLVSPQSVLSLLAPYPIVLVTTGGNIITFEERTWFVGPVVAARRREGHKGMGALMCGRDDYVTPGTIVGPR